MAFDKNSLTAGLLIGAFVSVAIYSIGIEDNVSVDLTNQQEHLVNAGLVNKKDLTEQCKQVIENAFTPIIK